MKSENAGLTILSPHQDDAIFSLCIAMRRWSALGIGIRIVNLFTISAYGPRAHGSDRGNVSELRQREDSRAFRAIDPGVTVISCDFLDAPLRLGIDVDSVCKPQADSGKKADTEAALRRVERFLRWGLIMGPLGLGDHVDHLITRTLACAHRLPCRVGFYEDLPYAMWTSEEWVSERVRSTEEMTRTRLYPVLVRASDRASSKRRIVNNYQSQITPEMGNAIAGFAGKYKGAERIWIPKHSAAWKAVIR